MNTRSWKRICSKKQSSDEPTGATSSSVAKRSSNGDTTIADVNNPSRKVGGIADALVNNAKAAATVPKVRNPYKKGLSVNAPGGATTSNMSKASGASDTTTKVNNHLGNVTATTSGVTSVCNVTGMYDCFNVFFFCTSLGLLHIELAYPNFIILYILFCQQNFLNRQQKRL